jgi:hypothetical protein
MFHLSCGLRSSEKRSDERSYAQPTQNLPTVTNSRNHVFGPPPVEDASYSFFFYFLKTNGKQTFYNSENEILKQQPRKRTSTSVCGRNDFRRAIASSPTMLCVPRSLIAAAGGKTTPKPSEQAMKIMHPPPTTRPDLTPSHFVQCDDRAQTLSTA